MFGGRRCVPWFLWDGLVFLRSPLVSYVLAALAPRYALAALGRRFIFGQWRLFRVAGWLECRVATRMLKSEMMLE